MSSIGKKESRNSILDKPLSRGKTEDGQTKGVGSGNWLQINVSTFALLFSEMVQYCQNRVNTVPELQTKLADLGYQVGVRILDVLVVRDRGFRRETKLLQILIFVKATLWKSRACGAVNDIREGFEAIKKQAVLLNLFGKEADKLEHANDDEKIYYIIEKEPLVNKFIHSDNGKQSSLNCASFVAGIIEAVLCCSNFPAKVTAHWHKGTAFVIKFDESVIARDKIVESR